MAISDNYIPIRQQGNGSTTQFSANWDVIAAAYLTVFFEDVTTGVQTPVDPSLYTLVFSSSGFTVTFLTAPANTVYVVIGRAVSLDQTDPYRTSKGFQGNVLEDSLDKLTAITQDLNDAVGRSLTFPLGDTSNTTLPTVNVRKGMALLFDAITGAPFAGAISEAAVSSAMTPVVQATTLALARTAMGVAASGANSDITSLSALTAITGVPINNSVIGAVTPAAGNFTTLNASGAVTGASFAPTSSTKPADGLYLAAVHNPAIAVNSSEAARFLANLQFLINCTSTPSSSVPGVSLSNPLNVAASSSSVGSASTAVTHLNWINGNGIVGSISTNGSATTYATSSDYRLKTNIETHTTGLDEVMRMRPVNFNWVIDGKADTGFIAHEIQAVVPNAVHGDKDAVQDIGDLYQDEYTVYEAQESIVDGESVLTNVPIVIPRALISQNVPAPLQPVSGLTWEKTGQQPVYQGVDTSFLVTHLVSAIQNLAARVAQLEGGAA